MFMILALALTLRPHATEAPASPGELSVVGCLFAKDASVDCEEARSARGPNRQYDAIISGGKDQMWSGSGDGDDVFGDDAIMRIPHYYPHPRCNAPIDGQFGA